MLAAFAALPDQGSAPAVAVLLDLATGAFFTVDTARMCDVAEQALTCARALARPGLLATAAAVAAHSCAVAGRIARARTHADEAGALLDARGDDDLAHLLDAVNRLAWAEHLLERFDDSIRHAARGVAVARATGQGQFIPVLLGAQALSTATPWRSRGRHRAPGGSAGERPARRQRLRHQLGPDGDRPHRDGSRRATNRRGKPPNRASPAWPASAPGTSRRWPTRGSRSPCARSATRRAGAARRRGWDLPLLPPTWGVAYKEALTRIELDAGRLDQAGRSPTPPWPPPPRSGSR